MEVGGGTEFTTIFFHPVSVKYVSGHMPETPDILA